MDAKDMMERILRRRVSKHQAANPELAAAKRGQRAAFRVRAKSVLAKFDTPMSPRGTALGRGTRRRAAGTFRPNVKLDPSQVQDRRRPVVDPKMRGRYDDEAGQPPMRKRSRINFRKRVGR